MKKFFTILILMVFTTGIVLASHINMEYNDGIYHFILSGDKIKKQIQFILSPSLVTNKDAHLKTHSVLTINTGFFDPKNQKTISYIVNNSLIVEDPLFNENLMSNPVLRQNLSKIIRSGRAAIAAEFKIGGGIFYTEG